MTIAWTARLVSGYFLMAAGIALLVLAVVR
jgi:hypothetical protein